MYLLNLNEARRKNLHTTRNDDMKRTSIDFKGDFISFIYIFCVQNIERLVLEKKFQTGV